METLRRHHLKPRESGGQTAEPSRAIAIPIPARVRDVPVRARLGTEPSAPAVTHGQGPESTLVQVAVLAAPALPKLTIQRLSPAPKLSHTAVCSEFSHQGGDAGLDVV